MKFTPFRLFLFAALGLLAGAPLHAQREKLPIDDLELVEKKWPDAKRTATGLRYLVLKEGDKTGASPKPGMLVTTAYVGMLLDGTVFDRRPDPEHPDRDQAPLKIRLGRGNLIDGWEEALQKMHKGDKWLLIVPAALGYGTRGKPPTIPRSATLVFEIELVDFAQD